MEGEKCTPITERRYRRYAATGATSQTRVRTMLQSRGWRLLRAVRLDYLSCILTVLSTILVGRRCWEGWALAAINSVIICVIGVRTAQFGFIPANLFCLILYGVNLRTWRKVEP